MKAKSTLEEGLISCRDEKSKILLSLAWLEEDAFQNTDRACALLDEAMFIDRTNVSFLCIFVFLEVCLFVKIIICEFGY